ncbi:multidrug ABC transporter permease [Bacteroidia bacterium]|nr:multidrug ABC transporter permease [Bacteroidia bacterium]
MQLFKYRLLQAVRDRETLFWALLFPVILGTFFYLSFWSMASGGMGDSESAWEAIPVAVQDAAEETQDIQYFHEFLKQIDGKIVTIKEYDSEDARLKALEDKEITGIFYASAEPSLTVSKSDINTSILKSLLDSYLKNAEIVRNVIKDHPENIAAVAEAIWSSGDYISNVDLSGKTMNSNVSYFFALIAYACLSGAYLGVNSSFKSQANLSALGARRSVTPTSKLRLILTDLAALVLIQFINIMVLSFYLRYVLKIPLGIPMAQLMLINLIGSIVGVSIGIILGCTSKAGIGIKTGLCVLTTLLPAFFAGLMFGGMQHIIELHAPIINRINPAAVLSDAYYSLSVFDDVAKFHRNLIILLIMSAVLLTIAFVQLRRERYDSI